MSVYVTTYEIIGQYELADDYYARINAAREAQWGFVREIGAIGFRPSHDGGVTTLFFRTLPTGWRKVGGDRENIEARPRKGSKIGNELAARISALPRAPQSHELAAAYGYDPKQWAVDGGRIYFPSDVTTGFERRRFFLRLPRFAEDGFEPDEARLRAIPESELMAAIEAHNAEAKRRREAHNAEAKSRREGGAA